MKEYLDEAVWDDGEQAQNGSAGNGIGENVGRKANVERGGHIVQSSLYHQSKTESKIKPNQIAVVHQTLSFNPRSL